MSTEPTCASSARRRCDTADWVTFRALGGALKAALLHDGGKAFEGGGVVSAHG